MPRPLATTPSWLPTTILRSTPASLVRIPKTILITRQAPTPVPRSEKAKSWHANVDDADTWHPTAGAGLTALPRAAWLLAASRRGIAHPGSLNSGNHVIRRSCVGDEKMHPPLRDQVQGTIHLSHAPTFPRTHARRGGGTACRQLAPTAAMRRPARARVCAPPVSEAGAGNSKQRAKVIAPTQPMSHAQHALADAYKLPVPRTEDTRSSGSQARRPGPPSRSSPASPPRAIASPPSRATQNSTETASSLKGGVLSTR